MYADGARISVSVATIEFAKSGDGTALTWTEQGACLDGTDGPQAPALRKESTTEMLNNVPRRHCGGSDLAYPDSRGENMPVSSATARRLRNRSAGLYPGDYRPSGSGLAR
jgi:hypothetical protein